MDPLGHNAALSTHDIGSGGPARRIATSAAPALPMPSLGMRRPKNHARENTHRSSLCDDDDEDEGFRNVAFGKASLQTSLTSVHEKLATIDIMESEDEEVTSSRQWNVRDESVPFLPNFHPLDRSSVFVAGTSALKIAKRIEKSLRARSIIAIFDTEGAKVKCHKDNVDFRVRLYRGRGEYEYGIIVEVQRRDGFELGYQMDAFAILDAAEGKVVKATKQHQRFL